MLTAAILISLCIIASGAILALNRFRKLDHAAIQSKEPDQPLQVAGQTLSVLTWNIGFAALGKDAEVYIDNGSSIRALSKHEIAKAAKQIGAKLAGGTWDVICLQESAEASFLTRGVDVRRTIDTALPNHQQLFWVDFKTIGFPRFLRFRHGMASYSAKRAQGHRILTLPGGTTLFLGFLKKHYVGLVNRLPIAQTDKEWVIINVHFPVYETTSAEREKLLSHVFSSAQREYEQGNYVVIAGDWNMRLCPTSFPNGPDTHATSWMSDFPKDSLPDGWHISADPTTPTLRTLNAPFERGQTYTTIFDGFVVSPNVQENFVKTEDMEFDLSDHQPVEASFSAR